MGRMMSTPWGTAQHQSTITRGMTTVSTASHGGIHLSPTLNAKVHEAWRDEKGWYEEDAAWAIVALTFPEHFGEPMPDGGRHAGKTVAEAAHQVAKDGWPDAYERAFGVTVTGKDSSGRAEQEAAARVAGEMRTTAAWGYRNDRLGRTRVPEGWVGVAACIGGRWRRHDAEDRWFLVPEAEYGQRPYPEGILIDPARHPEWTEVPAEVADQPIVVSVGGMSGDPDVLPLYAAAHPHRGDKVGELWRWTPPSGVDGAETWRAQRRRGMPAGVTLASFESQEAALDAVGFRLAPFAEVPGAAGDVAEVLVDLDDDVAAVFEDLFAAA